MDCLECVEYKQASFHKTDLGSQDKQESHGPHRSLEKPVQINEFIWAKLWLYILYKRPMGHIAHLRKQIKSINTNSYIITLIKRRKNNIINFMRIYCFFIWRILNPPHPRMHPRMLCAKIGWNWFSGSGEEDFLISSMYFHYFVIISPWKRAGPFIWTNLNPLYPRMLCAKFGWNWTSGSG